MQSEALRLLESLTQAHSVPGFEDEVRDIFHQELSSCGKIETDKLGSITCTQGHGPRILVAGHMDEVGFRVQNILPDGYLKIVPVGGWWGHTLLSQRVEVKTACGTKIIGTIASKPPHFLPESERSKVLGVPQMFIDIGAASQNEAHDWGIRMGDPVAPLSPWTQMHKEDLYMTKAFDNRVGMGGAIQAAQNQSNLPCTLITAGSVQEEVGLRGAKTLANLSKPDVALVLEGPPADDTPGMPIHEAQGRLGGGVQIRLHDPSAIMNPRLARHVIEVAEKNNINHQVTVRTSGGTDAGSLNIANEGVPCVVLGTPARYIHSHNAIIDIRDYLAMVELTRAVVATLDEKTVASFSSYL